MRKSKRALHAGHRALHDEVTAAANTWVSVIAHYRFRPPPLATTIRVGTDELIRTEGPAAKASGALRALYLLESDDHDAVLDLAGRIPTVQMGGIVEVWPLTEPDRHGRRGHRHESEPHGH